MSYISNDKILKVQSILQIYTFPRFILKYNREKSMARRNLLFHSNHTLFRNISHNISKNPKIPRNQRENWISFPKVTKKGRISLESESADN